MYCNRLSLKGLTDNNQLYIYYRYTPEVGISVIILIKKEN